MPWPENLRWTVDRALSGVEVLDAEVLESRSVDPEDGHATAILAVIRVAPTVIDDLTKIVASLTRARATVRYLSGRSSSRSQGRRIPVSRLQTFRP
jgi:hypothetical protein